MTRFYIQTWQESKGCVAFNLKTKENIIEDETETHTGNIHCSNIHCSKESDKQKSIKKQEASQRIGIYLHILHQCHQSQSNQYLILSDFIWFYLNKSKSNQPTLMSFVCTNCNHSIGCWSKHWFLLYIHNNFKEHVVLNAFRCVHVHWSYTNIHEHVGDY